MTTVDSSDDTILFLDKQPKSLAAVGVKRYYYLLGQRKIPINGKATTLKPGTCFQLKDSTLHTFSIKSLIESNRGRFPELNNETLQLEAQKQRIK